MENHIQVKKIWQENERQLGIIWTDDRKDIFDVVMLRRKCPCALCIDEWTHEPKLKPEDVPETLRPLLIQSVGRYALNIHFDDGHTTGIYTFTYLRELAEGSA